MHTGDVYHIIHAKCDSESLMCGFTATNYPVLKLFGIEHNQAQSRSDLIDAAIITIKAVEIRVSEAHGVVACRCHFTTCGIVSNATTHAGN